MTELIWEGKYDEAGRKVAPLRVALPFQTVETVNESAQERQRMLDLWGSARDTEWRNRLIWGDKKYVLPSLLEEFAGKVDLIYIDPPFDTGADFSFQAHVNGEDFTKEPNAIELKAYRDTWSPTKEERRRGVTSLDKYVAWLFDAFVILHQLLRETGSLYVHIGPNVSHYVKLLLDEVFGLPNYRNEIVWRRAFGHSDSQRYGIIHDALLFYSKSEQRTWNDILQPPTRDYIDTFFDQYDAERGERYQRISLSAGGLSGGGYDYEYKGIRTLWRCPIETLERHDAEGRLHWPQKRGGVPRLKRYESEHPGVPLQDLWTDISKIHNQSAELTGYATQKPEALLERIIQASSIEGDLIADVFCGSGTTGAVAERLGRRWIMCDLSRFAIHTTRKRLLDVPNVRPFVVQNLGKYERQLWQAAEFGEPSTTGLRQAETKPSTAGLRQAAYRKLILDLYRATPVNGYAWLHGTKGGRMVHVGAVDSPVSLGDVTQIAGEFRRSIGTGAGSPPTNGVDVLGWDFAFEMNETAKQKAAEAGIELRFLRIPHDVMDKRARDQGDIRFFELAALDVALTPGPSPVRGRGGNNLTVTLTLKDFVIPPDDVPEDVQRAITKWEQWIDYWAVDWDNKGDTFHNEWQDYRTRKKRDLQKTISHTYEAAGEYVVVVKVIDILGNDTTKTMRVKVG